MPVCEEAKSLERRIVSRVEPEREVPLVASGFLVAKVRHHAGEAIVRVGIVGVTLETGEGEPASIVQPSLAAKRIDELQEGGGGRVALRLAHQAAQPVSVHRRLPPWRAGAWPVRALPSPAQLSQSRGPR